MLSTPAFADNREVRTAMQNHIGDRPVTLPLLKAAWRAYQQSRAGSDKDSNAETQRVTESDLQVLTDEAVAELYGGVVRDRATEERKFRDMLRR